VPAPANCRSCGAALPPSVRWCSLCNERVLEFSPREPVHTGGYVGELHTEPRYTRWRSSPTTFGPLGRIVVTLAVILMGPWTAISAFTIIYLPAWIMLATLILKQVWLRQRVDEGAPPTPMEAFRERHPVLGLRVDPGLLLVGMGLILAIVAALTLSGTGVVVLIVLWMVDGVGALLAWFAGM
jgi:hypothetical protein